MQVDALHIVGHIIIGIPTIPTIFGIGIHHDLRQLGGIDKTLRIEAVTWFAWLADQKLIRSDSVFY